jgi:PAS domain S-box-containing protein
MPILFWIDIAGICMTILITGSLTLIAIGFDPKNRVNRSFALFTGAIVIWSISALFLRLCLWLKPMPISAHIFVDPQLWLRVAVAFVAWTSLLSLNFTVEFVGRRTRWTDSALIIGVIIFIALFIYSYVVKGSIIQYVQLDEHGLIRHGKSSLAWSTLALLSAYIIWSVILFWQERHRDGAAYLSLGMLIMLLGLILSGALYAPFPFISFSSATSALIMAYGVLRKQVFNPLKAYTLQLNGEIKERKKAEKLLRKSENLYRLLADNVTDVIWVLDMNMQLTYVSPSIIHQTGYTVEETMARPLKEVLTADSLRLLRKVFNEELKIEKNEEINLNRSRTIEVEIECKNQSTIYTEITVSFIRDQFNNPNGIIGVARDITSRKQLEIQLQQAQRMEAIGTLAGGVAHDLNNILSGIVSYPELILMDLPEDSQLRKPILTIKKSGEKAAVIVEDLLTLARRGVAISEVVDLNHIIYEQLSSPEFEKLMSFHRNVQLNVEYEKSLLKIKGSSTHLSKAIMNIISNAAEAMPEGGTIRISTENIYLDRPFKGYDHVKSGEYVKVTVSDTGVGISEADLQRIFEPFYTRKVMGRSGTGLGMAVVWGTVKDHNGYINIQSTVGKGTTSTLYFPVTRDEIGSDESELSIADYMGKGEAILVVDDVADQRKIATGILNRLGYRVDSVSSGEEAVEYLKENAADLIVLDMIMEPGINGLETYERIIKISPNQKAIIASGFSESDEVKSAQKLGAGEYIKKPYSLKRIGMAVRKELIK